MKRNEKAQFISLLLIIMLAMTTMPSVGIAAQPTVDLRTASSFGVLAGSTITNTGPTTVSGTAGGNIGLYPGDDPSMETFPGQADVTLSGTVHLCDDVAKQAKIDLEAAYDDAEKRKPAETITEDLGGKTLKPGVYKSGSSIGITGTLILDGEGNPNAVFIFQAGSTLTTAEKSKIELINDAQPCRIFWQVGSSATLGTNSDFVGHILAKASITANKDVRVQGQLLALTYAVTLESNTITNDLCLSPGSLKVTKDVQGSVDDMTLPDFEITVTGPYKFSDKQPIKAGYSYTWEGLASGTYTVSESVSESELSKEWNVSGTGEYDVKIGETTEVTITNSYITVTEDQTAVTTVTNSHITEEETELPRTGGNELLLVISGISIALAGGFFLKGYRRKKEN